MTDLCCQPIPKKSFLNVQEGLFWLKSCNYCFGAAAATGAVPGMMFTISSSKTKGEYGGIP